MRNKGVLFIRYSIRRIGLNKVNAARKVNARGLNVFEGVPVSANQQRLLKVA